MIRSAVLTSLSVFVNTILAKRENKEPKEAVQKGREEVNKYRLTTSLASLKDLVFIYQHTIKEARKSYFTNLITNHGHRPRIPFKVVKSVTSPPLSTDKINFSIILSIKFKIFVNNYTLT